MFKNKKALAIFQLVLIIISAITLIILISTFSYLGTSSKNFVSTECKMLFTSGISGGGFYLPNLRGFNEKFFEITSKSCNFFEMEVSKKNLEFAANRAYSCFEMLNGNENLLPPKMYGEGICFYCGEYKLKDIEFNELNEEVKKTFSQKQKNNSNINLNFKGSSINEKEIGLFFFQYREELDSNFDKVSSFINSKISSMGGLFQTLNSISSNDKKLFSGIAFAQVNEVENELGEKIRLPYIDSKPFNEVLNCKVIIPENKIN